MKQEWSKSWIGSVQPRKQRKYKFNAPLHIARTFLTAPLSEDLRKKYSVKSLIARKGDKVKVLRGQYKGKVGAIEEAQIRFGRLAVEGVNYVGRDGKKKPYLLHASKVLLIELNLDDKKRKASLERAKSGNVRTAKKTEAKPVKAEAKTSEIKKDKKVSESKSKVGKQ